MSSVSQEHFTPSVSCIFLEGTKELQILNICAVLKIVLKNTRPNETENSAGISKQSTGARNRVAIGLSFWPDRLHILAEIGSLESPLGLHKSLKIRALFSFIINKLTRCLGGGGGTRLKGPVVSRGGRS